MDRAHLNWADIFIIIVTMGISLGIGLYYRFSGGRQKSAQEYFSANKSMSIIPVAIALMVSFMSAITLLGVSAENYTYGTQFVAINLSYLIGTPIICYFYLPVFYNLGAISAYEYLEKRFGYGARLAASFASWIQLFLYSGVVLYAPSLALEATTQLDQFWSIVGLGLVCAFYSTIGGIKAVLITDVFQGGLMFASLFIVIITATNKVGSFSEIWRIAEAGGRIEFDSISIDPTVRHTWWGLTVGGLFTFLSLFGVHQIQVQRMMTLKSIKSARTALWLNWPILTSLSIATCTSGIAMYSYYYACDPLKQGRIKKPDELMPLFIMDTLSHLPGVPGLFVAGIFSAGLSTISAGLNSLSAVSIEDYIKPFYKRVFDRELTESKSLLLSKILVFAFGLACIGLAFLAGFFGGVLQTSLTIFGVVGGPLLGIFTLGMLTESTNQTGAVTGLLSSLVFMLWIAFGQPRPMTVSLPTSIDGCPIETLESDHANNTSSSLTSQSFTSPSDTDYFYLYRISYIWYSAIGFTFTFVVGLVVSYLSKFFRSKVESELDPDLFFPFISERIRSKRQKKSEINGNTNSDNIYVFRDKNQESPYKFIEGLSPSTTVEFVDL
ncbi:hypothetical protein QAD02_023188 [Eretmocerus hayati]|uniref:Uncharacterized protein n=1 Tax=Eretmocerus hayati TaxID=131215 RepID=A0ACC2PXL3_9HYME|nr:hypothetical protein QAD02_023188 [Eretmocerus hayati]